jgi:hypothetical protein
MILNFYTDIQSNSEHYFKNMKLLLVMLTVNAIQNSSILKTASNVKISL